MAVPGSFPYNDIVLSDLGDGEKFGPWGWAGGSDARPNRFVYAPGTSEELNVGMFRTNLAILAGRMLDCFQPGGGGYGHPFSRPLEYVVEDVAEGLVTPEGAERDYGVIVKIDRTTGEVGIDAERTSALRAAAPAPPDMART